MQGINVGKWVIGGLIAGMLVWLIEGAASVFYMDEMQRALQEHNLSMDMSLTMFLLSILVSLIVGFALVFFYAAARPRFGPGPKTAVIVAVALWVGGYLLNLLGYRMIGLFPAGMLVLWGAIGLVEMILAGILGAWIYREA
jgi:hypothetical protein